MRVQVYMTGTSEILVLDVAAENLFELAIHSSRLRALIGEAMEVDGDGEVRRVLIPTGRYQMVAEVI